MAFRFAQTFFVDPAVVGGALEVGITRIDLYFRGKPKEIGNKSGINSPGVEVSLYQCLNGIPLVSEKSTIRPTEPTEHGARFTPRFEVARKEYGEINASSDASAATSFKFSAPILLKSGAEYAIVVKYDGDEDFVLWYSRQGDKLYGTEIVSPGPSGKYIGNLFNYISSTSSTSGITSATGYAHSNVPIDPSSANSSVLLNTTNNSNPSGNDPSSKYLISNWKPISDTDLKFKVYLARYAHNGYPVSANSTILASPVISKTLPKNYIPTVISNNIMSVVAPSFTHEYVEYDRKNSSSSNLFYGSLVFQSQPMYPGGAANPLTISVSNGSSNVTANASYVLASGATFNAANGFRSIYTATGTEYIIIYSGDQTHIGKVTGIISNTNITIDPPCQFTNTAARFFKSPVAQIISVERNYRTGTSGDLLSLRDTNANASCRFVNNCIESITISANGTGYSNSDYLVISAFENNPPLVAGGYACHANIVTNSTGNVTAIHISNGGCGFVNTAWITGANVVVNNSSAAPTTGSGLTFAPAVGATLYSQFDRNNNYFANCAIINLEAHRIKPEITVNNPVGTSYIIKHRTQYSRITGANTFSGMAYYVNTAPSSSDISVKIFKPHAIQTNSYPIIPSRSNEYVIRYANGAVANDSVIGSGYSNSAVYIFEMSSNNDYTTAFFEPEIINSHYSRYIINNDYTNEHTNYGNAFAKHVTTKVTFNNERFAEDLLVYLTAYRPSGTDLKVYARIHNSNDQEAFDDKDWTLMEEIDGIGVYSSVDDTSDFIDITYNFRPSPNSALLSGSVRIANSTSTNIIGSSTTFDTDLDANSMVKIYPTLFPNSYFIASVNSVTNATHLVIDNTVDNVALHDTNLTIEKVLYPQQAFNNQLNDNVARYFSESKVPFDTYNTFQIKIIMLSNNEYIVPKIDDIRAIGVSA